ncbi:MAG: glycosyltransferase family 4 protein [Bacteroidota bacterium]|nr:glycosyltransferase family 4 protein [Bacteroidota bacterium]
MKKVIFITNIPNPYRIPLFNEMSRQFRESEIHLKLVFGAEGYKRRMFQLDKSEIDFDFEILEDKAHSFSDDGEKTLFLYRGLLKLLRRDKPDAIIVAGFSSATVQVFFHKLLSGTPYIIFSGSIDIKGRHYSFLRKMNRLLFIKAASAFVAYGNLAKKYLVNAGAPVSKVFIGRNTVDTSFFAEKTAALRKTGSADENKTHFTYVGYLVPRKNVQVLLEAIKIVSEQRSDFCVDILGEGISRRDLEKFVNDNKLNKCVTFYGFRQKEELPSFFAKSSGFLFQTGFDIWGLVLNEAMAAGLPCLASPNAGATFDLIKEGETGFVVDFDNRELAAQKIMWLIDHKSEALAMGKRGAGFIMEEVNLMKAANGFKNAVECVWKQK